VRAFVKQVSQSASQQVPMKMFRAGGGGGGRMRTFFMDGAEPFLIPRSPPQLVGLLAFSQSQQHVVCSLVVCPQSSSSSSFLT